MIAEILETKNPAFPSAEGGLTFIEQLQIVASKQCTKANTPYLIGVDRHEYKAIFSKAACKSWDCPSCGARNARKWIARIINGCRSYDFVWSLLTITSHRRHRRERSVACLRQGWKKLYNRLVAKLGKTAKNLYFCRIWEQHKDGSFHLHVLLNHNFGTRWAKNNARACGMGHQADWRNIDNAGMAAGYVAKYTLKNSSIQRGGIRWPRGLRRIEASRNWPKLPEMDSLSEYEWSLALTKEYGEHVAENLRKISFSVIDLTS